MAHSTTRSLKVYIRTCSYLPVSLVFTVIDFFFGIEYIQKRFTISKAAFDKSYNLQFLFTTFFFNSYTFSSQKHQTIFLVFINKHFFLMNIQINN